MFSKVFSENTNYINDLGKWSQRVTDSQHSEGEIDYLLNLLGKTFLCDRCYVFEIYPNDTFSNTYEWCKEGVIPQKDALQNESLDQIEPWLKEFEKKQPIVIRDIEDIKQDHSEIYAALKTQDIHSLISFPIFSGENILGFIGIDNSKSSMVDGIVSVLQICSNMLSYIFKTKTLENHIDYIDFHDSLTKSLNRNALRRDLADTSAWSSLGIIYCDITDLRKYNDTLGFQEGDRIIVEWNNLLTKRFNKYNVYRVGGNEFIILFPDVKKWQFASYSFQLEDLVKNSEVHLAFGISWSDDIPLNTSDMVSRAEHEMYSNKAIYYSQAGSSDKKVRDRRKAKVVEEANFLSIDHDGLLYRFIENNFFHLDTFFTSMSVADHHPYLGDLTTNLWYVSDSMKDLWGLQNNIVHDLLNKWEGFITNKEDLELWKKDIAQMIESKRKVHDLIYRINDKNGEEFWIRCFGLIKWSDDNSTPLFFCGNVSKLNYAFIIDPTTNFLREQSAIREIVKLQQINKKVSFVCFRLNGFSEINELKGRNIANNLIKDIAVKLTETFSKKIQFFRLDGLRFLAIVPEDDLRNPEEVANTIKDITGKSYSDYSVPIRTPCAVGILDDYHSGMSGQEIMNDIMSMLEIAKNNPGDNIVYSTNTVQMHRAQKQMLMALNSNASEDMKNFRVMIQPMVSTKDNRIVGGELLLRWKYEEKDVSPMIFIPALENNELIIPVGRWVFEQAVRCCKRVQSYSDDFFLDFNVSYYQINDETLLSFMKETLENWDLNGNHLVMELTETHYNDSPVRLQEFIDDCKGLGMRMALDDFGVGYSSLEMLLKYPANVVKLDRSLMKKMSDSKASSDFITTIVYACHKFGKLVCVEGVETEKELKIVTEAGCDMVQGYYFYKPMELNNFYSMLAKK